MSMDDHGYGGLVNWGVGVFAEKFKLVVCGFELEGEEEFGVDIEEEEEGNRRRWLG